MMVNNNNNNNNNKLYIIFLKSLIIIIIIGEKCNESAKKLSDEIRIKLKELNYDRYKFIVQVIVGERREQGVRMGTRCFWDSGTDNHASETFMNDNIFCVATAYAVYLY